jgi:hypothetical protein
MNTQKELFEIFQKKGNDFELYEELSRFIKKVEHNAQGLENAYFYGVLVKLSNSINNAGHENRRSDDISFIHSEKGKISDDYEDFLP